MLDRRAQRSGDGLHPPDSAFMEDGLDVVAAPRRPVQRTLADETSRTFAFRCFSCTCGVLQPCLCNCVGDGE